MGRFPNIAASKAKTGQAKGKLYGMYAKEIYLAAKNGGVTPEGNHSLKRLIEKAKKEQVPSDVIKRAIDKVSSGVGENYETLTYEVFGPSGSTFIVECLTDNVNRSVSDVRAVINKCHIKLGGMGSVMYNYDHLAVIGFKGLSEDETINALIENDVDFIDMEKDNDMIIIYANPSDLISVKEAISNKIKNIEFDIDEITYLAKEKVELNKEDMEVFNKALDLLNAVDDVSSVYHNVKID